MSLDSRFPILIPLCGSVGYLRPVARLRRRVEHFCPRRAKRIASSGTVAPPTLTTASIFAMAALKPVSPVEVGYRLGVFKVYQQATFALLSQPRSIQVLRQLASPTGGRSHELPSWTLDLSSLLEITAGP
ncbi:hypothetical protein F5144DRAFT_600534 [Chaetomium tenue]|uniref:Uncharacterized protein n=1 Tax=Chaetomium tenue TaxID=1854479 RepID=A0ACB7PCM1_9PEZI|nr:hypothetical protein F5144DRAFT_600534 [Chaetomium globosum]